MYILISIVFIAELIIAFNLIVLIIKADREVCRLNACVEVFNPLVETFMQYARCCVSAFKANFSKVYAFIQKKKEQIIYKVLVTTAIYLFLIMFKMRASKVSKIYKLIGAIRDIAIELAV